MAQNAEQCDNRSLCKDLSPQLYYWPGDDVGRRWLCPDSTSKHSSGNDSAAPAATTPKAATTAKAPVKKTGTATAAKGAAAAALTTRKQKFSYALGMNIGAASAAI